MAATRPTDDLRHLPAAELPLALAEVHRALVTGKRLELTMSASLDGAPTCEEVRAAAPGHDLPDRPSTWWQPEHLRTVVEAAGFEVDELEVVRIADGADHAQIHVVARSLRALPDHVGAGMALLCVGLNPSLHSADAGIGYVQGSNRYWKAMLAAGLATVDRDPVHLLRHHHIGMTDLVKRPTPRADEVSAAEFRQGIDRLEALCAWLRPSSLAIVGLSGWRAGRDRRARAGWQDDALAGVPVYVLPSTSGLNAGTSLADLVGHLAALGLGPVEDRHARPTLGQCLHGGATEARCPAYHHGLLARNLHLATFPYCGQNVTSRSAVTLR